MKIPADEYYKFVVEYYCTKPQSQRFGQAFWNKYLNHDTQVEDKLFYTESTNNAIAIIEQHYVNFNMMKSVF
jgi:hypothetical protein